ncbi:helicase [Malassezia sp. CBS 17886]|nr:helicase [Malassezia sp. CBS 17886]
MAMFASEEVGEKLRAKFHTPRKRARDPAEDRDAPAASAGAAEDAQHPQGAAPSAAAPSLHPTAPALRRPAPPLHPTPPTLRPAAPPLHPSATPPMPAPLLRVADPSFLCQWRAPQSRKHKTWEGDAVLYVHGQGTTCSLRSIHDGKLYVAGRPPLTGSLVTSAALRRQDLRAGDELYVGGKEVQIERELLPDDDVRAAPAAAAAVCARPVPAAALKTTRRAIPTSRFYGAHARAQLTPAAPPPQASAADVRPLRTASAPHARYDPHAADAVVMKRPCAKHQALHGWGLPVVDVVLDPELARVMRPHQVEGVRFLYEAVTGMASLEHGHASQGQGAILADEMGLGKTLQTIALVMTLLRQNCYYSSVTSGAVDKVVIVCPLTLVVNWKREFRKWVGRSSVGVLAVEGDGRSEVERFVSGRQYQVLILGYERLRSCAKQLATAAPPVGLVVCDEGHRLKSKGTKTTQCFDHFSTRRRVLLTGTPVQNDLREFYAMVDFVYPGMFDQYAVFKRVFEDPIMRSRLQYCPPDALGLGRARSHALQFITKGIILRRTAELLASYLPPRYDMVLFCTMSPLQARLYALFSEYVSGQLAAGDRAYCLGYITLFRQLCNAPSLLSRDASEGREGPAAQLLHAADTLTQRAGRDAAALGGKLAVLHRLLTAVRTQTTDRVVVVSYFTGTLDVLQRHCTRHRFPVMRLDGSTKQEQRAKLVNAFNREGSAGGREAPFVFLLSSKSGGTGLNLIGANRLVLFDSDWNPSNDRQAMARIHRDGQQKPCYTYRLLLAGSMDEKIYQRQSIKMGLSDSLVGSTASAPADASSAVNSFSQEELRDIFAFQLHTECATHELLRCPCDGDGATPQPGDAPPECAAASAPPGFVSAASVAQQTQYEQQQREKLARHLGDMRHYRMRRGDAADFPFDAMVSHVCQRQSEEDACEMSPRPLPASQLLALARGAPSLADLVDKYAAEPFAYKRGQLAYVFARPPSLGAACKGEGNVADDGGDDDSFVDGVEEDNVAPAAVEDGAQQPAMVAQEGYQVVGGGGEGGA